MNPITRRIAIVGGGISGLTAAYELERARLAGLASDHLITVNGTALSAGAFLASQP